MRIEGLNAIVTGGASGLGKAVVKSLSSAGAQVAIFDIDEDGGNMVAAETGAAFYKTDVCDETEVVAALDAFEKTHGPARILVNCAGIAPKIRTSRREGPHRMEALRLTMEVNVTGTFLVASRFAHKLRDIDPIDEENGVIVNVSSIAAFDGQTGHCAYAASKAAVAGMNRPLALDLAPFYIRANCIAPGPFYSPMIEEVPNGRNKELGTQIPHPARLGKPEEFALLVEHIIRNPMLNGEVIRLDGAMRLAPH